MAVCEVCGNDYDKAFQVVREGNGRTFDSFECAIHAMAPTCGYCQVRVIGHGLESKNVIYCSRHCAERSGVSGLQDRV